MQHKTTATVYSYFNALRADRTAPLRNEIDPSALTGVLPDLFILEKTRDGSIRFRLAGTRFCLILGREMRDRTFAEIWDPLVRHRMQLAADTVLANRRPLEIAVTATDEEGNRLALEMLMLPLFSRSDECDRIFGSLVCLEATPLAEGCMRVLTPTDITFTRDEPGIAESPGSGPVSVASPIGGALRPLAGRASHLRVVDGGRRD